MVKNLVGGVLKKGDKEDAPKEDVPDELPPLNPEQTPAAAPAVPNELPSINDKNPQPVSEQPAPAAQPAPPPAPEVAHTAAQPEAHHQINNAEQAPPDHFLKENPLEAHETPDEGFFPKLHDMIKSQQDDSIMSQNLLHTMKESYSIKKEATKTGLGSGEEKKLKSDIEEVLATLKLLEGKWRAQRLVLDEDEKTLKEYEKNITTKEADLKKLLKHYSIYETKPGLTLVLKNYIEVRSISDLYNALRLLDQQTFSKHVGKGKNDFAAFVHHFDVRLSKTLKKSRTKKSMLAALEKYIKKSKPEA